MSVRQAEGGELSWSLVLDSLVFAAEAEIRWLDHCEARLRRAQLERPETLLDEILAEEAEEESNR